MIHCIVYQSASAVEGIIDEQDIDQETMASGRISFNVVKQYFFGGLGCFLAVLIPISLIMGQVGYNFCY